MEFFEETVSEKSIYKGNVTEYTVQEVRLPDGKLAQREIVRHAGASAVIPFTQDGRMVLVKQYRKAIEQLSVEIPAGIKDEVDDTGLVTAKRELEEETGYQADEWEFVTSFFSTPGFTDEYLEIYEATGLKKVDNPLEMDDDEAIELIEVTFDEAWDLYGQKLIRDSKTVFALFYWKMKKLQESLS
ncbi:NUDIX hydrolase [Alkalibacterium sp.]|nr:MAG: NUDIX hydrolase [Alkalibacterium sp.]